MYSKSINQSINDFNQVSEYIAKGKDHYSNKGHLQKLKKIIQLLMTFLIGQEHITCTPSQGI